MNVTVITGERRRVWQAGLVLGTLLLSAGSAKANTRRSFVP